MCREHAVAVAAAGAGGAHRASLRARRRVGRKPAGRMPSLSRGRRRPGGSASWRRRLRAPTAASHGSRMNASGEAANLVEPFRTQHHVQRQRHGGRAGADRSGPAHGTRPAGEGRGGRLVVRGPTRRVRQSAARARQGRRQLRRHGDDGGARRQLRRDGERPVALRAAGRTDACRQPADECRRLGQDATAASTCSSTVRPSDLKLGIAPLDPLLAGVTMVSGGVMRSDDGLSFNDLAAQERPHHGLGQRLVCRAGARSQRQCQPGRPLAGDGPCRGCCADLRQAQRHERCAARSRRKPRVTRSC